MKISPGVSSFIWSSEGGLEFTSDSTLSFNVMDHANVIQDVLLIAAVSVANSKMFTCRLVLGFMPSVLTSVN